MKKQNVPVVMEDGSKLLKNESIKWTEKFNITEKGESDGKKWIKIGGTAAEAVISLNKRKYLAEELAKQDIRGKKVFLDHFAEATNAVGIIDTQAFDGQKLSYEAKIRNTARNPDVVEMAQDGLIKDVSIGAMGDIKQVKENNESVYEVHNLKIEEISLVGIAGIPGAGIDYTTAVAEKFNIQDNVNPVETKKETVKIYMVEKGGTRKWMKLKQQ